MPSLLLSKRRSEFADAAVATAKLQEGVLAFQWLEHYLQCRRHDLPSSPDPEKGVEMSSMAVGGIEMSFDGNTV